MNVERSTVKRKKSRKPNCRHGSYLREYVNPRKLLLIYSFQKQRGLRPSRESMPECNYRALALLFGSITSMALNS